MPPKLENRVRQGKDGKHRGLFSSFLSSRIYSIRGLRAGIISDGLKRIAALMLCSLFVVFSSPGHAQDFGNIWNLDGVGKSCDPTKGSEFVIKNDGAYVAEFEVYSGPVLLKTSPNILLGHCYRPGRGNLLIKGYVYTGLVWNPRVLFMTAWARDRDYIITYGTTLDARAVGRNRLNPDDLDVTVRQ